MQKNDCRSKTGTALLLGAIIWLQRRRFVAAPARRIAAQGS
jgi:hypothetical protein